MILHITVISFLISKVPWVLAMPHTPVTTSKHPIILVVVHDGLPAEKVGVDHTPAMETLRTYGAYVPYMEPVFPTKTYPNLHSIVTGLYAENHGVVDNEFLDLSNNKNYSGFEETPGFWSEYNPDILPLWILNEFAGDGRVSGALWPGAAERFGKNKDLLPTYHVPQTEEYLKIPWEGRVNRVISWMTNETKPANLVFLYYDEPDEIGHAFGPNSPEYFEELKNADLRTAYLVKKLIEAEIYDKVNLIILSDHGTAAVTMENMINVTSFYNKSLIREQFGDAVTLNLMPIEGKKNEVYESLYKNSFNNHFKVWRKEQLSGYPFYYSSSRRIFDLVVIADSGYVFDCFTTVATRRNDKYNITPSMKHIYGEHGYSPLIPSMRATFIAHGPAFVKGISVPPIKSVDVFSLIAGILGIRETPNNGSVKRIKDMVRPEYILNSGNNLQKSRLGKFFATMFNMLFKGCPEYCM